MKVMKDILGREIKAGHFIAYALIIGRSANQALYEVKEVGDGFMKARKLDASYGMSYVKRIDEKFGIPVKYMKFEYDDVTGKGEYVPMTNKERERVDNKVSTITMGERAVILQDFDPSLLEHL